MNGAHWAPADFPQKGQVMQNFGELFAEQSIEHSPVAGDVKRRDALCDVILMERGDCFSACVAIMKSLGKYVTWVHKERPKI